MGCVDPAELEELRARSEQLDRAREAFAEIAELMESALHNPAWPIDACCRVRRLAWDHQEPPCT